MGPVTLAEQMVDFAWRLRPEDIPESVRAAARLHVADTVGVAMAASREPWAAAVLALARSRETAAGATVWVTGSRAAPETAALVNGTLAHGLDYDDTHVAAVVHPSAAVVPAAVAAAEAAGSAGRDVLAAVVAAYETVARLGMAAAGAFHARGFHPTGVLGVFGATLAAARLFGLTAEQAVAALGVAGSQGAGLLEFLANGSGTKRLHPGWAAHGGILAALLAAEGFTGPATVLEGRYGLFPTHLGDGWAPPADVFADLGTVWETERIACKAYPSCHFTHAFVDAALQLREEVDPAAIVAITLRAAAGIVPVVLEPWEGKLRPDTPYAAKFSLPYCVAAAFRDGHLGLGQFDPAAIRRPDVLALAARCRYAFDPEADYPRTFAGWVEVETTDGRRLERRVHQVRGLPERPLTRAEVAAKFQDNLAYAGRAGAAPALWRALETLDAEDGMSAVVALFRS